MGELCIAVWEIICMGLMLILIGYVIGLLIIYRSIRIHPIEFYERNLKDLLEVDGG